MIPSSDLFDQSMIRAIIDPDPRIAEFRALFSLFDCAVVDDWQAQRSARGRPAHPESADLKAFLIRQKEGFSYTTQLRRFLLKHPLLVIELGFHLVLDPSCPYGFDVEETLPCRYWFTQKLRLLDRSLLQDLLHATVRDLMQEIPGLGEVVAFDVKHIFAWVRENNPHVYVEGPFNVTHLPKGDPDCRLGVKKSSNQEQPDGSKKEKKVSLFGYGTGVAACTDPVYGDVVLAEYTLPFNEADVTYYRPLFQRAVIAANQFPTHVTADAAYDYWYVYETVAHGPGIAAIPSIPMATKKSLSTLMTPREALARLRIHPTFHFHNTTGFRPHRCRCPSLFLHPQP